MEDIAREALAVAQAEHISVPDNVFETIRFIPATMAGQHSSTAQDPMRGKPTEIDFLNGEIVKRAARFGLSVPINRTLTLLIKSAGRGEAENPERTTLDLNQ